MVKTCSQCRIELPRSEFYVNKRLRDGLFSKCKPCTIVDVKANRLLKLDYYLEYDRSRAMDPSRVAARNEYAKTERGKSIIKAAAIRWVAEHPERRAAAVKNYHDKTKKIRAQKRIANSVAVKAMAAAWKKKNMAKVLAYEARRRASKLQRMPKWLSTDDKERMHTKHKEARCMTRVTGVIHHVDHIVPLLGLNVSGLHVPWNLRVIPASFNLAKNKYFKG